MAKQISHADLQIRILELENEGYPVEITFFGEQEFPRGYLDPGELPWVAGSSPIEDGERLFEWLFADDQLKTVWAEVRGQRPQRRIRLRIDAEAPELHAIPWELLRDNSSSTAQDISAATTTPFSRYLAGQWQPGGPILQRPIKILLAIANPENIADFDLASLEVDKEIELIEAATKDLDVELTTLDQPVTLAAIETAIEDGHHIIHFVGHGTFSERRNHAQIFLADNDNQVALVKDSEFAEMIANHLSDEERPSDDKLRMVFLASCQTATRSSADPFRGFAPALVQVGLPAVVAMQDLVPIETAQAFSTTFYQRLIDHGTVDLASNEARSALITADLPGSAIPVLFMRLQSGLLFAERGQILGDRADSFWNTLLDNIADGECTPFLGPGVTTNMLPSKDEMARTLARDYSYPFPDRSNLPKVAQFVGTLDNRRLRRDVLNINIGRFKEVMQLKRDRKDRRATLSETIDKSDWSTQVRTVIESEIHHRLADLELPLYLTTNTDNFMTLALQAKGLEARQEVIDWREKERQESGRPHYDLDPQPNEDEPVVLHLFGTDGDLLSMVVTEDDYLDYLTRIARDHEYLLPTSVHEALASTTLLFLGYRLEDLDMKVIMRGLLTNLDLERWGMLHVAVQIENTDVGEEEQQEIIRYFQKYFSTAKIDIYWGNTHQFVADLHARWQEYMND